MSCKSSSCSCAVSTASTGFQLMMRHVCMASLYLSSSVHTGEPSSKALTKTDVMHKQFLQLCCFYSIHRFQLMMRHVGMALLYMLSSVHTGDVRCVACCVSLLEILDTTHCRALQFFATQCQGSTPVLTLFVYVPWLNRLVSKTVSGGLFGPQRIN